VLRPLHRSDARGLLDLVRQRINAGRERLPPGIGVRSCVILTIQPPARITLWLMVARPWGK
jgi:hypothetical protein